MSGQFPGMNPYLEDPTFWSGMHNRLIFCASEALNSQLPSGFVADIEERIYCVSPVEMHEWYLTIRTATRPRRVVTILEILSPANKAAGSADRREYLQKQQEILHSETHLLEIDLLRAGAHTVAAPYDLVRESGDWDYLVCLHRSNAPHQYSFWKIHLRNPLPLIQIPLTSEEPDTVLDLQAVFDRAYDTGVV